MDLRQDLPAVLPGRGTYRAVTSQKRLAHFLFVIYNVTRTMIFKKSTGKLVKKMGVTREDVGRRAGVSGTTVAHVLNGTKPVTPEVRQRVLAAAK